MAVFHRDGTHLFGDQARQAFVQSQAQRADALRPQSHGRRQHQVGAIRFQQISRADFRLKSAGDQRHHPRGSSALLGWPEFGYGLRWADESTKDRRIVEFVSWRGDRDERAWPSMLAAGGIWPLAALRGHAAARGHLGGGVSRSPLTDRCECSYEPGLPAVAPHTVTYTGNDSLRADYRCRCGRSWWTSWGATGAGWPTLVPVVSRDRRRPTLEQLQ